MITLVFLTFLHLSTSSTDSEEEDIPGYESDSEEDEEDDDDKPMNWSVHTSFLDEKAIACQAIGVIASNTKAAFFPYLEKVSFLVFILYCAVF